MEEVESLEELIWRNIMSKLVKTLLALLGTDLNSCLIVVSQFPVHHSHDYMTLELDSTLCSWQIDVRFLCQGKQRRRSDVWPLEPEPF